VPERHKGVVTPNNFKAKSAISGRYNGVKGSKWLHFEFLRVRDGGVMKRLNAGNKAAEKPRILRAINGAVNAFYYM
jgi:hypothetical protein